MFHFGVHGVFERIVKGKGRANCISFEIELQKYFQLLEFLHFLHIELPEMMIFQTNRKAPIAVLHFHPINITKR